MRSAFPSFVWCFVALVFGSGCSSDPAAPAAATDASTAADVVQTPPAALPVPTLADGTCEFVVDGTTYAGNKITSVAVGNPAGWQLQCQSGDGRSLVRTVNVAARGMATPGTYVAAVAPKPDGIASYSEQNPDGTGLVSYAASTGWTVTLSTLDAKIVGATSLEGVLAGKPSKVTLAFNLSLTPKR